MSELERKAAFKSAVTLKSTTMERAAREEMGVTFHHLTEGLAGKRPLSEAVQEKFAAFIGRDRVDVFGGEPAAVTTEPITAVA